MISTTVYSLLICYNIYLFCVPCIYDIFSVSGEKRSALLAEVARLKEERSSESGEAAVEDSESISQQPCRGTVSITNIQLPLKVEYVCSSHNRAGTAAEKISAFVWFLMASLLTFTMLFLFVI